MYKYYWKSMVYIKMDMESEENILHDDELKLFRVKSRVK